MVLEMNSNGSFYIRGNAGGYSGKYTIKGQEITLKGDPGTTLKFTIRNQDTLVEDTGEVFITSEGMAARQEAQRQERQTREAVARTEQQRTATERENAIKPTREIARLPLRSGYANDRAVVGEAILTDVSIRVRRRKGTENIDLTHFFDEVFIVGRDSFDVEPDSFKRKYLYGVDDSQGQRFFRLFSDAWQNWREKYPNLVPPHRRPRSPASTPFRLPDSINN